MSGPDGFVIRPFAGEQDIGPLVKAANAESLADGVQEAWSEAGVAAWLSHPTEQFDASRDVMIAELGGRVVGGGGVEWIDTRDGLHREFRHWGVVHPEVRGRGIGTALLAAQARHATDVASGQSYGDRTALLGSFASVGRPGEALLRDHGYGPARYFFDMVRPTLEDVAVPPMPEGLELRPVTEDQHETIWRANREAFRDHWGGSDESLEAMRRHMDDPDTDTSLWLIAWDGDQVAGGVWNEVHAAENQELGLARGWLASVFTRRAWRRRGLAAALIGKSLELLRERGLTSAALGVDADNPLGALGLYETAGFEIHERFTAWQRPLEVPGR